MAKTIRENILAEIEQTLKAIKSVNGYDNTMARVGRWDQRRNPLSNTPCITIALAPESKEQSPNPFYTCRMTVLLDIWLIHDDIDQRSTDEILASLLGDVEKCIMQDTTRGGNAIDTDIKGSQPFEGVEGQPYAGMVVELEILYQHKLDDPTVAA